MKSKKPYYIYIMYDHCLNSNFINTNLCETENNISSIAHYELSEEETILLRLKYKSAMVDEGYRNIIVLLNIMTKVDLISALNDLRPEE